MGRIPRTTVLLVILALLSATLFAYALTRPRPPQVASVFNQSDGSYKVGSVPGGADPVRAAVESAQLALSYDYRRLGKGLDQAVATMTPAFGAKFRGVFGTVVAKDAAAKQAVVIAVVKGAGLVARSGAHAVTLAFVDQIVVSGHASNGGPLNKVVLDRVRISLDLIDGVWRVSAIDPV